jgi:carbamoyl-phosphate synthase large subunit
VVVKFARWAFEKFKGVEDKLGTQMRAVGEVMSLGKNYKEALSEGHPLPGKRPLWPGVCQGLQPAPAGRADGHAPARTHQRTAVHHVRGAAQGRRRGRAVSKLTHIKPWFIEQMKELVELEERDPGAPGPVAAGRVC